MTKGWGVKKVVNQWFHTLRRRSANQPSPTKKYSAACSGLSPSLRETAYSYISFGWVSFSLELA
jgi:hypothetical protein